MLIGHANAHTVAAMSDDPRHRLGRQGEELAARHLGCRGCTILARNHRTRYGEIDIVAFDPATETLVFCEVKTRRAGPGSPWDALGPVKQRQVRRMAAAYLCEVTDRPPASGMRFDAIGVTIDARDRLVAIEHLEGAF